MIKANILTEKQVVERAWAEFEMLNYGRYIRGAEYEMFLHLQNAVKEFNRVERSDFRY